ncbi:Csu type fimbrial protein [Qipengyuania qiaonensis]|uniref:Spore coat U domain-containing protein n=1 Tax=Qipengyuania qiaonensis TaxID=2867240 RepID=A0ABS7J6N3_9SPHN|nr:spore coat U domain-containing protein [Qipengyuania qiaonensis]
MKRELLLTSVAAFAFTGSSSASAQATLTPTVEVIDGCTVLTAEMFFDVSAGAGAGPIDSSARIDIECTRLAIYRVDMNLGSNAAGTQRRMRNPSGDVIPYGIYRNAARTQTWGSGWGSAPWGLALGLGRASLTAYGRINSVPANLSPGVYEDIVTVSITF